MKIPSHNQARRNRGFSLAEFSVAMTISVMVLGSLIYAHVAGQQLYYWAMGKVGASNQAREAFFRLQEEIRTAKNLRVGTGTYKQFTPELDGEPQKGTALQIYPTTNTASYIRYYLYTAPNINELRRIQTGVSGYRTVASSLTNSIIFAAEDFAGNTLTEVANNRVISVTLQFYQFQYPVTRVGDGYYYDYYRLQTKITKRNVE